MHEPNGGRVGRMARLLGACAALRREVGAYGSELSSHWVEAWFMVTSKPLARLLSRVRAWFDFSRRR